MDVDPDLVAKGLKDALPGGVLTGFAMAAGWRASDEFCWQ